MVDEKAPFNSALDILERLADILRYITKVKQNIMIDKNTIQGFVLSLTKDYYLQAVPLLSMEGRKKFEKILYVEQKEVKIVTNGLVTNKTINIYTNEVEKEINKSLIDIQIDLQDKGGYFMPTRRDRGKSVADFG